MVCEIECVYRKPEIHRLKCVYWKPQAELTLSSLYQWIDTADSVAPTKEDMPLVCRSHIVKLFGFCWSQIYRFLVFVGPTLRGFFLCGSHIETDYHFCWSQCGDVINFCRSHIVGGMHILFVGPTYRMSFFL